MTWFAMSNVLFLMPQWTGKDVDEPRHTHGETDPLHAHDLLKARLF